MMKKVWLRYIIITINVYSMFCGYIYSKIQTHVKHTYAIMIIGRPLAGLYDRMRVLSYISKLMYHYDSDNLKMTAYIFGEILGSMIN